MRLAGHPDRPCNDIRPGDVVLFEGRGPLHQIVRVVQSVWHLLSTGRLSWPSSTHCAIVVSTVGGPMICEQELMGCRMYSLERRMREFNGTIRIMTPTASASTTRLMKYCLPLIGNRYGYWSLVSTFVFGRGRQLKADYCSALVALALDAATDHRIGYDGNPMPSEVVGWSGLSGPYNVET